MGCSNSGNTESSTDAPTKLPCDRACRRRRHPHALRHAEGAAQHRRTHAARACAQRGDQGGWQRDRRGGRARSRRGGASGASARAQGQDFRAEATARHRACGTGGAHGDRARRRRHIGDVRRHAAGAAANADRVAHGAGARRGGGGAGFQAGQSSGLRAAADARRRAAGDPRRARRQRRGTQDRALQRWADGAFRRHRARHPRPYRQCQCQGRILSHRRGCYRPRYGLEGGCDRNRGGRHARDQYQGAARRNRGRLAAALARRRARCRRHHDRAGDGVSLRRHQIRQGRHHRAQCGVRTRRHGRRRRADPVVFASGRRPCRQGRPRRTVRAVAAGRRPRRRRAYRQFRRGEGGQDRGRRQGQSS